jgi:hypothetical protein
MMAGFTIVGFAPPFQQGSRFGLSNISGNAE